MHLRYLSEVKTNRALGMTQGGMHQIDVVIAMGTSQSVISRLVSRQKRNA